MTKRIVTIVLAAASMATASLTSASAATTATSVEAASAHHTRIVTVCIGHFYDRCGYLHYRYRSTEYDACGYVIRCWTWVD